MVVWLIWDFFCYVTFSALQQFSVYSMQALKSKAKIGTLLPVKIAVVHKIDADTCYNRNVDNLTDGSKTSNFALAFMA